MYFKYIYLKNIVCISKKSQNKINFGSKMEVKWK